NAARRRKPKKLRPKHQGARAVAKKARSENSRARAEARARMGDAFAGIFWGRREQKTVHSGPRDLLVKALGMLGSEHAGERASAALIVEKQRARLGMTWDELIIPAEAEVDLDDAA